MQQLHTEVLVSYDIENTKQRTKLFNKLKDISLIPIQKSVFWGYLSKAEQNSVRRLLKTYCSSGDKAFIAKIELSKQVKNNSIGHKIEEFPSQPRRYHVI